MSRRNFEVNRENLSDRAAAIDWLPEISEYGIADVVCVAGKNPDDEKILKYCMVTEDGKGCPNLISVAMIAAKPDEVIGKPRYRQNLAAIHCRLKI